MTERNAPAPRITRRAAMLLGLQATAVGGLAWRMRDLQITQNEKFALLAEENRVNLRLIPPARGLILDRNGAILAGNRRNYRVSMVREQARDVEAVLDRLAEIIPLPPDRRERAIKEMGTRSAFVPVVVAEHLTWDDIVRVSANAPILPGVVPEVGLSRTYPDGFSTAHVVGYVGPVSESDLAKMENPDPVLQIPRFQIGKTGFEAYAEDKLRGSAGTLRIEVSAAGRVMRELGRAEGTPGDDVELTLDRGLQDYAMRRMAGQSASAVVLDVRTGDVMAMASAPGFDPNSFVFGIKSAEWKGLLEDEYRPLSHKAVTGNYPPGSTFKMVMALAALDAGMVSPGDTVGCGGFTVLGNRRFYCWKKGGHGRVDMRRSLSQSCDCYYYEMGRRLGPDRISAMAKMLGLGEVHDLPLPGMSQGNMPDAAWKKAKRGESWTTGDSFNYGIGQGFTLATPLQLAVYVSRIASGTAVKPRLVRKIGGVEVPHEPAPPLDIDPKHLAAVRGGMFAVSNEGTAFRSRIVEPTMLMAGKTGTSQVRIISAAERAAGVTKNEQLPWKRRDHALFVCYAPFDNPRYAVAQIVEHGGGGSLAAAPIARDILLYALYGGLPPLSAYPPEQRQTIEEQRAAMPDLPVTGGEAGTSASADTPTTRDRA